MSADGTGWPLLDERPRTPPPVQRLARRARARPAWALALLAFVCGGLVSAAGFSIGWKHLAQSGTAAQTKLAAATAHVHRLDASLAAARGKERRTETRLAAAVQSAKRSASALSAAAASLETRSAAAKRAASPVSDGAVTMTATAARVSSELKTLSDYLTGTPAGQLDSGYVATQIAYLTRQLTALQASGGDLEADAASFRSAADKLAADAASLSRN